MESKILTFDEWSLKTKQKTRWIEERIEVKTDRLYGSIPDAIEYLKEIHIKDPDLTLSEHWTGYEDMEMVFSKTREETYEEFKQRLAPFYEVYRTQEKEKLKKIKDNEDKDRREYERLKKKFG